MKSRSAALEALFVEVCETDVRALKPGNVGLHGAGHGMCVEDFTRSAAACAPAMCRSGVTLGERILAATAATRAVVGTNTNLGIILLCAPLIQAALDSPRELRSAVEDVLERTTIADAVLVYRAIRAAQPGGMGKIGEADLSTEPEVSLRDAMSLARERDQIAAQYACGYRLLFDEAVPVLLEFHAKWGYADWSAVGVYLTLLGRYPDSLVARKHGVEEARKISVQAATLCELFAGADDPEQIKPRLLEFDRRLKRNGVNPGTTADLVAASLFIAGLNRVEAEGRAEGNRRRSKGV